MRRSLILADSTTSFKWKLQSIFNFFYRNLAPVKWKNLWKMWIRTDGLLNHGYGLHLSLVHRKRKEETQFKTRFVLVNTDVVCYVVSNCCHFFPVLNNLDTFGWKCNRLLFSLNIDWSLRVLENVWILWKISSTNKDVEGRRWKCQKNSSSILFSSSQHSPRDSSPWAAGEKQDVSPQRL